MKDFIIAGLLYIGLNIGVVLAIGTPMVIIGTNEFFGIGLSILRLFALGMVLVSGYIYTSVRGHERARRITLYVTLLLVLHTTALEILGWYFTTPMLS